MFTKFGRVINRYDTMTLRVEKGTKIVKEVMKRMAKFKHP